MKHLIKAFLIIIFFTSVLKSQAQINFGIKAGLNGNNIYQNFERSYHDACYTKMLTRYQVGAIVEYSFNNAISLQSGVSLSTKGFNHDLEKYSEVNNETVEGSIKQIYNYLEIPFQITYKFRNFQVYVGPYVAYGINGKIKLNYSYIDSNIGEITVNDIIKIESIFGRSDSFNDWDSFSALDYGLNCGIGYQLNSILINAGYSWGLANLTPGFDTISDDPSERWVANRVITLSVSYFLGKGMQRKDSTDL